MSVEQIRERANAENDYDDSLDANAAILTLLHNIDALVALNRSYHAIVVKYQDKYGAIE